MNNFQQQINKLVAEFVAGVTELAHLAAVETLQRAFLEQANGQLRYVGKSGSKRTNSELVDMMERVRLHVVANPGQRMEQINKALGTTTKDLQLPIRKLISDGRIYSKGSRRVTQYFAKKK
ncbi:MAG: hypothetical protein KBG15_16985 [Kofleriaceae bacterium]|nr:hypothetical protein [Kofleriaceae bacterium]